MKWLKFLNQSSADKTSHKTNTNSPVNTNTKTYIVIFETGYRHEFDIQDFFKGNQNRYFETKDHSVSKISETLFVTDCKVYDNLDYLFEMTPAHSYGMIKNSVYVLESPYSEEEVKEIAVHGMFSNAITRAYPFHEADLKAAKENRINKLTNPNFDANLSILKKPQPSSVSPRLGNQS